MAEPTRLDILQGFLDGQQLMLDLYDAVEAAEEGALVLPYDLLMRMGKITAGLVQAHKQLAWAYAVSGRAADDLLARVRDELRGFPRRVGEGEW